MYGLFVYWLFEENKNKIHMYAHTKALVPKLSLVLTPEPGAKNL